MTIALIERHFVARIGLMAFLNEKFENVEFLEFRDCNCFINSDSHNAVDLIIIGFAEESTLLDVTFISRIRQKRPGIPMVVIDGLPRYEIALTCISKGISGYILKAGGTNDILSAIESVGQGNCFLGRNLNELLLKQYYDDSCVTTEVFH